jgi:hypothetical protein
MSEQKSQESDFDYTYKVIDAVTEAMDRVAAKPEMAQEFIVDLLKKMPELVDALMTVTMPEHRQKVAELVKSSSGMIAAWAKMMAKSI